MNVNKEDHIMTLPKRYLKRGPYSIDMNDKNHLMTLPKKDLKRSPYSINMNKKDLKRLSKSELIKMLLKQKKARNHEDLLDNDPFKDEVAQQEPTKHIKPRNPITGRFVRINSEVPDPPKQSTLPRLRDAKGRFISRHQSEPIVQQAPIQIRIKPPKT